MLHGSALPSADTIQMSVSRSGPTTSAATHFESGLHAYAQRSAESGPLATTSPFVVAKESLPLASVHARREPSGLTEKLTRGSSSATSVVSLNDVFSHHGSEGSDCSAFTRFEPSPRSLTKYSVLPSGENAHSRSCVSDPPFTSLGSRATVSITKRSPPDVNAICDPLSQKETSPFSSLFPTPS